MTTPDPRDFVDEDMPSSVPDPLEPELPPDPEIVPSSPDEPLEPLEPELPPEEQPIGLLEAERLTRPAPGGANDPGASASDENHADTPGYAGAADDDPVADPAETALWDEGAERL